MTFKYLTILSIFSLTAVYPQAVKWMAIGDLQNWYSAAGCEIEIGRTGQISDQQDGLRWPAFYRIQDNQAAKGLWLQGGKTSKLLMLTNIELVFQRPKAPKMEAK